MKIENKPTIKREESAILVVDMQNDFIHDKGKYLQFDPSHGAYTKELIENNRKFLLEISKYDDIPVIFTKASFNEDYIDAGPSNLSKELGALQRGTWGWEVVDELKDIPLKNSMTIEKQRYSSFKGTNLDWLLKCFNRKTIIVTGCATNICVESTVRDGRDIGYNCVVISDCTAAFKKEFHENALKGIDMYFGTVLSYKELLEEFEKNN